MPPTEELQKALANLIVYLRSSVLCPHHGHTTIILFSHDGPVPWSGPVCMMPQAEQIGIECEWLEEYREQLDAACEALGTRDMSNFLP